MRLGKKKEKDVQGDKGQQKSVDSISRLICLSKGQNPLNGKCTSFYPHSHASQLHNNFSIQFTLTDLSGKVSSFSNWPLNGKRISRASPLQSSISKQVSNYRNKKLETYGTKGQQHKEKNYRIILFLIPIYKEPRCQKENT